MLIFSIFASEININNYYSSMNTTIKISRITTVIILLIYCCIPSWAKRNITKFDIRDGLSSNYIMSITQDKYGYLWLASEEGLTQMDGSSFMAFYKNDSNNSLPGNALNIVLADKELPYVWIGTQRDGLSRYNVEDGTFKSYRHNDNNPLSIATNDITAIEHADSCHLWLGTFWRGVELMDKQKGTFCHYNTKNVKGMPENRVWCVADDGQGHLYIGHDRYGVSVMDIKTRTAYNINKGVDENHLPGSRVNKIVLDDRGRVWIATDQGLAIYHPQEKRMFRFDSAIAIPEPLRSGNISTMSFIDGAMWVAAELHGVYTIELYGTANPIIEHIGYWSGEEDLSSPSVRSIFKDNFGNIWLGTWNGGLDFISHRKSMFSSIKYNSNPNSTSGLLDKTVLGLCCDGNGRLWTGMDDGGVAMLENGIRKGVFFRDYGATTDKTFIACKRSSNGRLWFGSYGGWIATADENRLNFEYVRLNGKNGRHADIRCFYEDINGDMLVGTGVGLFVLDSNGGVKKLYDMHSSGISEDNVHSICRDSKGDYWIGTFGQGLTILSADMRRKEIFNTANGFPSNTINQIINIGNNRMAVATGSGLVVFDNNKMRVYGKNEGLHNDYVRAVAVDRKKRLWISTNKGLAFIDGDRIISFENNRHIGYGEFSNAAVDVDSTGTMYFGYNGGVCFFYPMDIDAQQPELQLQFTSLIVYGETPSTIGKDYQKDLFMPLVHQPDVELNYRQNNISVGFNVRDYALNSEVDFSYRIREHGKEWHNVNVGSQVTFRNMSPGSYTLEVRYRMRGGEWNKNIATLHITITPPWWRSWWALAAYGLIVISIILYNFITYRRKLIRRHEYRMKAAEQQRQMEMNQEKLQFYINAEREARDKLAEKESLADNSEKRQQAAKYLHENDNLFIRQVASIISADMASGKLDIAYIAGKMNMSTSSLYRKMKSLTGMGPNEFINKVRMKEAEEMLIQGKYSISEVAFRLGFSTPAYFRHCFKDEFGMAPSEYIKNYTK